MLRSICVATVLHCLHTLASATSSADLSLLNTLYTSTGGASWRTRTGWSSNNADPCTNSGGGVYASPSMYGIKCNDNTITDIVLSNNNLNGDLSSWGCVSTMLNLDLSQNTLTGGLPSFGGSSCGTCQLQFLDISQNSLGNTNSWNMFQCTDIQSGLAAMNISYNAITDSTYPSVYPSNFAIYSQHNQFGGVLNATMCDYLYDCNFASQSNSFCIPVACSVCNNNNANMCAITTTSSSVPATSSSSLAASSASSSSAAASSSSAASSFSSSPVASASPSVSSSSSGAMVSTSTSSSALFSSGTSSSATFASSSSAPPSSSSSTATPYSSASTSLLTSSSSQQLTIPQSTSSGAATSTAAGQTKVDPNDETARNTMIGISVGATVGGLLVLGGLFGYALSRKRQQHNKKGGFNLQLLFQRAVKEDLDRSGGLRSAAQVDMEENDDKKKKKGNGARDRMAAQILADLENGRRLADISRRTANPENFSTLDESQYDGATSLRKERASPVPSYESAPNRPPFPSSTGVRAVDGSVTARLARGHQHGGSISPHFALPSAMETDDDAFFRHIEQIMDVPESERRNGAETAKQKERMELPPTYAASISATGSPSSNGATAEKKLARVTRKPVVSWE